MQLAEKVAIVTGAGRGIGRAIARRFAAEGAAVLLAARTAGELNATAGEITDAGGRAAWVAADVSRESDCEGILRAARERFGGADILVNNAGIYGPVKPIEEITPAEWDAVVTSNLRGAFLLTRLLLPEFYARGAARFSIFPAFPQRLPSAGERPMQPPKRRFSASHAPPPPKARNAACVQTRSARDRCPKQKCRRSWDVASQSARAATPMTCSKTF